MLVLTDDRLTAAMRRYVTAANRMEHLSGRSNRDLALLEQVDQQLREAAAALQEALVERGWRRPAQTRVQQPDGPVVRL